MPEEKAGIEDVYFRLWDCAVFLRTLAAHCPACCCSSVAPIMHSITQIIWLPISTEYGPFTISWQVGLALKAPEELMHPTHSLAQAGVLHNSLC